jgi:predicted XRE-type DNA-binding protein
MGQIAQFVNESGWTQAKAAAHCRVTQPRINDLLRARVSRFSIDALVNIATALGCMVHIESARRRFAAGFEMKRFVKSTGRCGTSAEVSARLRT